MLNWMFDPAGWAALVTLTALEIVLGIDNVVFISVLVARLPDTEAKRARAIGLILAFVFRLGLLFTLTALMTLTDPVFTLFGRPISWRDMVLISGGLFLVWKATAELHREIDTDSLEETQPAVPSAFAGAILQIAVIDLVFSIDSIVTAIGMAQELAVMVLAILISMLIMYLASGAVAKFIRDHPTTKVLALSFLVLIGVSLLADGWDFHIPRGYIYFAMSFAAAVETINVLSGSRKRRAKRRV